MNTIQQIQAKVNEELNSLFQDLTINLRESENNNKELQVTLNSVNEQNEQLRSALDAANERNNKLRKKLSESKADSDILVETIELLANYCLELEEDIEKSKTTPSIPLPTIKYKNVNTNRLVNKKGCGAFVLECIIGKPKGVSIKAIREAYQIFCHENNKSYSCSNFYNAIQSNIGFGFIKRKDGLLFYSGN